MPEQREIAGHVGSRCLNLDAAVERLQTQLDLLAEYRQALITAAVTGQLDIGAEQPDPEEEID